MRKGVEINVNIKKRKVEIPRKWLTITVADNIFEDPDQAVELAVNVEERRKIRDELMPKERHVSLVIGKEVDKEVEKRL
ncbi:hypothetical protein Tco_1009435 [Tanacetum coccineum]